MVNEFFLEFLLFYMILHLFFCLYAHTSEIDIILVNAVAFFLKTVVRQN